MGVPKFFRYISERYPCLSELVREFQIPDFDNLYLDMNGIIHSCSHPNDFDSHFSITEEKIFTSIFHYIEVLFNMIKPRKLFFLAVDGVAPRAKMNQQRARRFRTAKEAEMKDKKALKADGKPLPKDRFDSNCITPGTVFMDRLHSQLKYFISSKISTDPLWQNCKIILSGHQTPGEGEHKIMDYIRYMKTLPDYDENTKHCLYGLDADLIMLGLCTHEPHFSLLREKVQFSKQQKRMTSPDETEFYLLHLSLLREYLGLEFQELKDTLPFQYNIENIVDDWVLMGFLVGNDFIPNLPGLHISKGALPMLYKAYKEVLPALDGYLNENGYLNLARFEQYMERMAKFDLDTFEDTYSNLAFFEMKTGKSLLPGKRANGCPGRKSDLEELIRATEEFEMSEDESFEEYNDNEEDTLLWEFSQHKKHYYTDKMDFGQVTPEVLKSQAEGYIRAIQWNLHYYYQGCQSWSWYYPHHYSPYISDIRDFKHLKLTFDMGKPFLPFEQLLAVLPAASKGLLPVPYHHLMTSPTSPIKDFYPEDFQTDLNGKKDDWEAVVLIPFIDEKRLLDAMRTANGELTAEERGRNQHGPMHVFTFTEADLGPYRSIQYFPTIPANHALMVDVRREEVMVELSRLQYGLRPGVRLGVLYPGFPTLRHIPFTGSLKVSKVKVFEQPSRGESMTLTLKERKFPSLPELAKGLLGKIVYVNWPYLVESRAVAVSDGKVSYSLSEKGCPRNEVLEKSAHLKWVADSQEVSSRYQQKLGVEIGRVNVIVYALTVEGRKYAFQQRGKVSVEKMWSSSPAVCPVQLVVEGIEVEERRAEAFGDFRGAFPVNSVVFMLGQPHFGSMGRVVDGAECAKSGRVKVALETVNELLLSESFLKCLPKTAYFPCRVAAVKMGVSPRFLSRITGAILVSLSEGDGEESPGSKINIGLNMKFNKKNEEIPGYTKKESETWLYSAMAMEIVSKYLEKFSRVVDYLSNNCKDSVFLAKDIFPGAEGAEEMKEIRAWLKEQEYNKVERLECGTEVVNPEAVAKVEKLVEEWPKESCVRQMQVKPHLLYKSDLVFGNVPPVKGAKHRLLDRVVSIRSSYTVPTGLRGFIIGIHPAPLDADFMYDVLFDEPFVGAMRLSSSTEKVFRMSRASFLNISEAHRQLNRPPTALFDPVAPVSLRPSYAEPKPSAFAQWSHPPPPPCRNGNDSFQEMWSSLHAAKPQEDALKKILKIEKKEKPIEDPVKSFFEKIKTPDRAPRAPAPPRNNYYRHLLAAFQQRNWGQPNFKFLYLGGKVMAQVSLKDGRNYSGLPCEEKESACDSAALQALGALGEIPLAHDAPLLQREGEKRLQPQARYQQPLARPKGNTGQKRPPHPNNRMPALLPDPPSQWVQTKPQDHPRNPPRENQPKPTSEVKIANRKLCSSALEFVPLQAIAGKRSSGKIKTSLPPTPSAEAKKKTEVVATFFNISGNPPSAGKPKRRSKIAAKLDFDPNL